VSDKEIEDLRQIGRKRKTDIDQLFNEAIACYESPSACHLPDVEWDPIDWPLPRLDMCEKLRMRAYDADVITSERLEDLQSMGLVPMLCPGGTEICAITECEKILQTISPKANGNQEEL